MGRKFIKPAVLVALGILLAFPLFSLTYYTMVRTSTPQFCSSCHEIRPAYYAWRTSTHTNNAQGIVVDCMDCHLPAPHDTFNFFFAKTMHGAKDVFVHFTGGDETYDRAEMHQAAYRSIKNDQCLKCHRNLEYMPQSRGAMMAHRVVLHPVGDYEYSCFDCHRNLVHMDSEYYRYKELEAPYRSQGFANQFYGG